MKTWADAAGVVPPATSIDRNAGEGPPRCCARRIVAADALVCYDDLAPERLAAVLERLPQLKGVSPLYLCDGCASLVVREEVVTREELAVDLGLSADLVSKARDMDQKAGVPASRLLEKEV